MTHIEKAKDLCKKYLSVLNSHFSEEAKECALIDLQNQLNMLYSLHKPEYTTFSIDGVVYDGYELINFYEEVKNEIENL